MLIVAALYHFTRFEDPAALRAVGLEQLLGVDQRLRPGVQPVDGAVEILWRFPVTYLAGIEWFLHVVGDDLGAPAVAAADMFEQLLHGPPRTGGYLGIQVGSANDFAEGGGFLDQG